jgi:hypothetical protein
MLKKFRENAAKTQLATMNDLFGEAEDDYFRRKRVSRRGKAGSFGVAGKATGGTGAPGASAGRNAASVAAPTRTSRLRSARGTRARNKPGNTHAADFHTFGRLLRFSGAISGNTNGNTHSSTHNSNANSNTNTQPVRRHNWQSVLGLSKKERSFLDRELRESELLLAGEVQRVVRRLDYVEADLAREMQAEREQELREHFPEFVVAGADKFNVAKHVSDFDSDSDSEFSDFDPDSNQEGVATDTVSDRPTESFSLSEFEGKLREGLSSADPRVYDRRRINRILQQEAQNKRQQQAAFNLEWPESVSRIGQALGVLSTRYLLPFLTEVVILAVMSACKFNDTNVIIIVI